MKHQEVGVDFYAMLKAMFVYGSLTAMCWLMLRLFNIVFMFPRRLRAQHANMEDSLKELQRRYPKLNITEEDLKNAEKDLEELLKEDENPNKSVGNNSETLDKQITENKVTEDKKTI